MLKRTCIDATRTACIVVLGDFDKRRRFICERRYSTLAGPRFKLLPDDVFCQLFASSIEQLQQL